LRIHSVLVSTFLDAAPSVFAPSGQVTFSATNVELVCAVGQIAKVLYGALLSEQDEVSRVQLDMVPVLAWVYGTLLPI